MKVLIVGLGYAGTRFLSSFDSLRYQSCDPRLEFAYVGGTQRRNDLRYFSDVNSALADFQPEIVILSVNDIYHAEVSRSLAGYRGFVLCEKPFVCPSDDLDAVEQYFTDVSGFCLNLVERYSPITENIRQFVKNNDLELLRANFTWGKDRLGDHRPTCGVTSEIIHPLDLVQHIAGITLDYRLEAAHGICSDFSVSGLKVPDSISVLARLGETPVIGYASFVNVSRRREIGLTFTRQTGGLVFANMNFDDPAWDDDCLRVWEMTGSKENILLEQHVQPRQSASGHFGISKLERLALNIYTFVNERAPPQQAFPDLETAVRLQRILNAIHEAAQAGPIMSFSRYAPVEITTRSGDWERLG